jgi:DnaK suppressor protein
MTLIADSTSLTQQMTERLRQRQAELLVLLRQARDAGMPEDSPPDVTDFKDVADEETRAIVDEVAHTHAVVELAQTVAALRRVDEGTYGLCEDCGEAIDERRLRALPATPFCTPCQARHERAGTRR